MALSSVHGLDDLGSMSECENGTIGEATYSTLGLNVTHIPLTLN